MIHSNGLVLDVQKTEILFSVWYCILNILIGFRKTGDSLHNVQYQYNSNNWYQIQREKL